MSVRTTHTYVELEISEPAYREIRAKLIAADYSHCFEIRDRSENGRGPIDLTGIAVIPEPPTPEQPNRPITVSFRKVILMPDGNIKQMEVTQDPEGCVTLTKEQALSLVAEIRRRYE